MRGPYRDSDPDETKPPTRMDELWGMTPPPRTSPGALKYRAHPPPPQLTSAEVLALYRAACDCVSAGAYAGATALLRRLILHETVRTGRRGSSREEAERLLESAETLLGLSNSGDPPSNA